MILGLLILAFCLAVIGAILARLPKETDVPAPDWEKFRGVGEVKTRKGNVIPIDTAYLLRVLKK